MKLTATDASSPLEIGAIYHATCVDIEPSEGEFGNGFKLTFDNLTDNVTGEEVLYESGEHAGSPYQAFGFTSDSFARTSKLRGWSEALLRRKIENGEELDTDSIIGCEVLLVIEENQKGMPKIGNLLPVRNR